MHKLWLIDVVGVSTIAITSIIPRSPWCPPQVQNLVADQPISSPTNWLTDRYALRVLFVFGNLFTSFKIKFNLISFFIMAKEGIWQLISPNTKGYFFVNIDNEKVKKFLRELFLIVVWLFLARSVCLPTEKLKIKWKFNNWLKYVYGLKKESFNLVIRKEISVFKIIRVHTSNK